MALEFRPYSFTAQFIIQHRYTLEEKLRRPVKLIIRNDHALFYSGMDYSVEPVILRDVVPLNNYVSKSEIQQIRSRA